MSSQAPILKGYPQNATNRVSSVQVVCYEFKMRFWKLVLEPALELAGELGRLVVPVSCPGCGRRDEALCSGCASWLQGPLRRVEGQVPRLDDLISGPLMPVWALGTYDGPVRGQIVAFKDKGREDLAKVFAAALARQVGTCLDSATARRMTSGGARRMTGGGARRMTGDGARRRTIGWARRMPDYLVPMPSSRKSERERGRSHLMPLAKAVAKEFHVEPAYVLRKETSRDQVGLGLRARGTARLSLNKRVARKLQAGANILLLDDICTTGATLKSAHETLTKAGFNVVGAVVLAATKPTKTELRVPTG